MNVHTLVTHTHYFRDILTNHPAYLILHYIIYNQTYGVIQVNFDDDMEVKKMPSRVYIPQSIPAFLFIKLCDFEHAT